MKGDKEYEEIKEGKAIIASLKSRYPEMLWAVNPDEIVLLAVSNKNRPEHMRRLAQIKRIDPPARKLLVDCGSQIRYYIEVYLSDYVTWGESRKQWLVMHELLHVPGPGENGMVRHDIEDFAVVVDPLGVRWWHRDDLPSLLEGERFPFKEELWAGLHDQPDEEGD